MSLANDSRLRERRPALARSIQDHVVGSLRARVAETDEGVPKLGEPISELRLRIAGNRTAPEAVQLVVITSGECPAALVEWFEAWWDVARERAEGTLELLRPQFVDGAAPSLSIQDIAAW